MLEKRYRLRDQDEFQQVFAKGTSIANRQFVIYMVKKEEEGLQIGLSVSKKLGNAVTRNRVKRLIRESLRHLIPQIIFQGHLVIIARPPVTEMTYEEVTNSLSHVLNKAKIMMKK